MPQGNKPTFGNAKQKILKAMPKEYGEEMETEYRLSAWMQIDNGWDNSTNRPMPMNRDQQAVIDEITTLIENNKVEISLQVQERQGADIKDYPLVARWRLFCNKPSQISNEPPPMGEEPMEYNEPPMDVPDPIEKTPSKDGVNWDDL